MPYGKYYYLVTNIHMFGHDYGPGMRAHRFGGSEPNTPGAKHAELNTKDAELNTPRDSQYLFDRGHFFGQAGGLRLYGTLVSRWAQSVWDFS